MIGTINPEILWLKQEDEIKAGLLDMQMVMDLTEKTNSLFEKGDIVNPPKTHLGINETETHPWDAFFNTMPCHIKGEYNIAGVKWAAESNLNAKTPGIPYGIDITILSDPVTVLPFCVLDGTIVTAMRTSAVAALQAKYCAPSNSEVATCIGCGVIGRTMIMALKTAVPSIKKIYLYDLDYTKAEQLVSEYSEDYPDTELIAVKDFKPAIAESQVITTETTAREYIVHKDWIKPNTTIICLQMEADLDIATMADGICVDYFNQLITFPAYNITKLYKAGKLNKSDVVELGELINGKKVRTNDEQFIYCTSLGLGSVDIMVGYELFKRAQKLGLGTTVKLWDKPIWE